MIGSARPSLDDARPAESDTDADGWPLVFQKHKFAEKPQVPEFVGIEATPVKSSELVDKTTPEKWLDRPLVRRPTLFVQPETNAKPRPAPKEDQQQISNLAKNPAAKFDDDGFPVLEGIPQDIDF